MLITACFHVVGLLSRTKGHRKTQEKWGTQSTCKNNESCYGSKKCSALEEFCKIMFAGGLVSHLDSFFLKLQRA